MRFILVIFICLTPCTQRNEMWIVRSMKYFWKKGSKPRPRSCRQLVYCNLHWFRNFEFFSNQNPKKGDYCL